MTAFETPLIERMRKASASPITLVLAIVSFLAAALSAYFFITDIICGASLDYGAIVAFVSFVIIAIGLISVYALAKKTDMPLSPAGFSLMAIGSVIVAATMIVNARYNFSALFFQTTSSLGSMFIKSISTLGIQKWILWTLARAVPAGVILLGFIAFILCAHTVKNNRPHKFFLNLYAVICFLYSAVVVANFVWSTLATDKSFPNVLAAFVNSYPILILEVINIVFGIIAGIWAIKLSKASKEVK